LDFAANQMQATGVEQARNLPHLQQPDAAASATIVFFADLHDWPAHP
jgi:hypothetical protein